MRPNYYRKDAEMTLGELRELCDRARSFGFDDDTEVKVVVKSGMVKSLDHVTTIGPPVNLPCLYIK